MHAASDTQGRGQAPDGRWHPTDGGWPAGPGGLGPPGTILAPPTTNRLAVVAVLVAVVCWPAGIVLGHLARGDIRRTGEGGRGLATAALVIGYALGALFVVSLLAAFAIPLSESSTSSEGVQTSPEADVLHAMATASARYSRDRSFPIYDGTLLKAFASAGPAVGVVPGTTAPTAGRPSVSAYAAPTGQLVIFSAADGGGGCWVGAVNQSDSVVSGVPPGHAFAAASAGGCQAQRFADWPTGRWAPSFATLVATP